MRFFPAAHRFQPWAIVIVAMLFYAFNYLLRTSPSAMMQPLLVQFHIDAAAFGSLAACYYYIYTPMQIPVGLMVDRYPVRWILAIASVISVVGLLLFTVADRFWIACGGRLLIGFGCAFAYISVIKLAAQWLPANRFATAAGLTTAFGMLAGAGSGIYLTEAVHHYGYQEALRSIFLLGLVVVGLLFLIVRDHVAKSSTGMNVTTLLRYLRRMLTHRQMWIISIIACFAYLPASVFLDVWGLPYLVTNHHLSAHQASWLISFMFMGWIVAGPTLGLFSDAVRHRRFPLMVTSFGSVLIIFVLLYAGTLPPGALAVLLFIFGFCAGAHPLVFSLGRENNATALAATSTAFINTITMLGGVIFQPVVGLLLDQHHGHFPQAVITYTPQDFTFALGVLPICLLLSLGMTFFIKETHGRPYEESPGFLEEGGAIPKTT